MLMFTKVILQFNMNNKKGKKIRLKAAVMINPVLLTLALYPTDPHCCIFNQTEIQRLATTG